MPSILGRPTRCAAHPRKIGSASRKRFFPGPPGSRRAPMASLEDLFFRQRGDISGVEGRSVAPSHEPTDAAAPGRSAGRGSQSDRHLHFGKHQLSGHGEGSPAKAGDRAGADHHDLDRPCHCRLPSRALGALPPIDSALALEFAWNPERTIAIAGACVIGAAVVGLVVIGIAFVVVSGQASRSLLRSPAVCASLSLRNRPRNRPSLKVSSGPRQPRRG